MPSNLRLQLDIQSTQSFYPTKAFPSPPAPKTKMSLTQTYRVASTARGKLGMEAARPDHNLRLLVGHANLLDSLMVELAAAEREQEAWFHETIRGAHKTAEESTATHIEYADEADYEDDSSSDSASDFDDDEEFDLDEDTEELALERVHSRVPELVMHEDSEESEDSSDDDEAMPPSPPLPVLRFSNAKSANATIDFSDLSNKDMLLATASSPMISAY